MAPSHMTMANEAIVVQDCGSHSDYTYALELGILAVQDKEAGGLADKKDDADILAEQGEEAVGILAD